jgi:hypothetical protein
MGRPSWDRGQKDEGLSVSLEGPVQLECRASWRRLEGAEGGRWMFPKRWSFRDRGV